MAELAIQVIVSPLLEVIFDKLSSPILNEFGLLWGVNKDLDKLRTTASTVRLVLQDAEVKQINDAATRHWLTKLKDAAYEADDIIDECQTEALLPDSEIPRNNQVCASVSTCFDFKHMMLRRKIGKKIKAITETFDHIAAQRAKFHLSVGVLQQSGVGDSNQYRETSSTLSEPKVYGRDEDQKKMVETLLRNANSPDNLSVYPVLGMGGIGKTTLAQLIYNDKRVVDNFEPRIWVCVSDDFSANRLTRMIIENLSGSKCELENLDTMQKCLKELLNGKKFLLILDDVWNESQDKWNQLKFSLTCGVNGSSIIVTTRLGNVASIMGTHVVHNLAPLSDEECWFLFMERAFGVDNRENRDLEAIGRQIVTKCGGLPLAAKAMGGLLRFEREVNIWISVRDNKIWELSQDNDGGILPSLRLSYNHLPSHLKQCFAFCSIFPKDTEIEKETLIQLWMANGFVQSEGRIELEDRGNQIFNQLVLRSFFQDTRKDLHGTVVSCKMHDLMHDLASSVTVNECCVWEGDKAPIIPQNMRHLLFIYPDELSQNIFDILSTSHPFLRTFLSLKQPLHECPFPETFLLNLDCLRVLDLGENGISKLPVSTGNMKHLRYLNLSISSFTRLPKSIYSLRNLQTLILSRSYNLQMLSESISNLINLRYLDLKSCTSLPQLPDGMGQLINLRLLNASFCRRLTQLPDGIGQLINLRHLDISFCGKLTQLPNGLGGLINLRHLNISECDKLCQLPVGVGYINCLQTLPLFIVGSEGGWSIKELHGLNSIRGKLVIKGLEHVRHANEAKEANLAAKQNLSSLSLIWVENNSNNSQAVLEGLQPPLALNIKLVIRGYGGSVFPSWMELLQNLVEIELTDCSNCERLPPLGQLPLLKSIRIERMESLKHIGDEFYGNNEGEFFPSLETLIFLKMPNLEKWHALEGKESQTFPCLEHLTLSECHKLASLPFLMLACVHELCIRSCEKLVVRSLPCLTSLQLGGKISFPEESFQNLDALESLEIMHCREATIVIPKDVENLTALKLLIIHDCGDMVSLQADGLPTFISLNSVEISYCKSLKSLPTMGIQGLKSSLVSLKIEECHSLTSLSECLQYLSALEELHVLFCKHLEFSSGDFQHLINLKTICLRRLPKLTSLPKLQHLHTLQSLEISVCENLKVLTQGMQNLTSLQSLKIANCHADLHIQCEKDTGDYWPDISHIPSLQVSSVSTT